MRTKHLLLTMCALVFLAFSAQAQPRDSKRFQAIENQKAAYITKELNLTPAEAQKFFPIYNQYNKEIWQLRQAKTDSRTTSAPKTANSFNGGSNKRDIISFDAQEVEVKKQYRKKFAQVVGTSRASQFFVIEQNFRELLYKELQNRKRNE